MRIEDLLYDVREVELEADPERLPYGRIVILGDAEELGPHAHKTYMDFLQGIDIKATNLKYDIRVSDDYSDIAREYGCNILTSYPDLFNGRSGLMVASAPPEEMGLGAVAVAKEIERRMKHTSEAMIALAAMGARSDYHHAVDMLFHRLDTRTPDLISNISFQSRVHILPPKDKEPKRNFNKLSDQSIRDVYLNLPDRYTELYERKNQEAMDIVRHSLDVIDQKSLVELLFEVAKTDRNFFRKIENARQNITAKYSIIVRKWNMDLMRDFKAQFYYLQAGINLEEISTNSKEDNSRDHMILMCKLIDRMKNEDTEGMKDIIDKFNEEGYHDADVLKTCVGNITNDEYCALLEHNILSPDISTDEMMFTIKSAEDLANLHTFLTGNVEELMTAAGKKFPPFYDQLGLLLLNDKPKNLFLKDYKKESKKAIGYFKEADKNAFLSRKGAAMLYLHYSKIKKGHKVDAKEIKRLSNWAWSD